MRARADGRPRPDNGSTSCRYGINVTRSIASVGKMPDGQSLLVLAAWRWRGTARFSLRVHLTGGRFLG